MTREEWDNKIKDVFDNLTKEQYQKLINNTLLQLYAKSYGSVKHGAKFMKTAIQKGFLAKEVNEMQFDEHLDNLSYEVFKTVIKKNRISFKQFKMLSAFSKTNWLIEDGELQKIEEFKQF